MIQTLDELFEFISNHEKTCVFGNLGRMPNLIVPALHRQFPAFKILILSKYYDYPSEEENIRNVLSIEQAQSQKCDLLILAEPITYTRIEANFHHASRVVVLTSHLVLDIHSDYVPVIYFHNVTRDHIKKTKNLLDLQDASDQDDRIDAAKRRIDHLSVVSVGPYDDSDVTPGKVSSSLMLQDKNYVVVNLTNMRSPLAMLLYFWDAFDWMIGHDSIIERWRICFPKKGIQSYDDLVQECINKIICRDFEDNRFIFSVLPFYKSGILDRNFKIEKDYFMDLEYVAPKTMDEAFKASLLYNLYKIAGPVYRLK